MNQLPRWQFSIDSGGTFTDVIARTPTGELRTHKTLSSGYVKGRIEKLDQLRFLDTTRQGDPDNVWKGYELRLIGRDDVIRQVLASSTSGELELDAPLPEDSEEISYELRGGEAAPVVGIRYVLGLSRLDPIPPLDVRHGSTRGTNALLERQGARTAYLTTTGFGDALKIGHQNRPRLFDLTVRKPAPLHELVVEIEERIAADGTVVKPLDEEAARRQLRKLKDQQITSLAICLMHGWKNPEHETRLVELAREVGFEEISASHDISSTLGLIARGDTTLVNAYLNPVLRTYLQSIREALPGSSLKLMTSGGGLVDSTHFHGKDSILSGPAGGVVGLAEVTHQQGFQQAIGFDMGGTSTDVCRYDGEFHREYEATKAGVRLATPMMAIETVAAGGGSICHFDGVRLKVGPQSAGAHPGPCCYGNDGPLTITDMNVMTGRILPEHFPFALDVQRTREKLEALCREIENSSWDQNFTCEELAEAFLKIANIRMARAIRKISAARGYNPADHQLVSFGGAGGQHACALARELGMETILIHPLAGLFSAYGIGCGDLREIQATSVLTDFDEWPQQEQQRIWQELEQQARKSLTEQGATSELTWRTQRSLDLRYHGTETALTIAERQDDTFLQAFEKEFRQRFGYLRENSSVEVVTARVEMVAETPHLELNLSLPETTDESPDDLDRTQVFVEGTWQEASVCALDDMKPGPPLPGPAVLLEKHSTIFVAPGYRAEMDAERMLKIIRVEETASLPQRTAAEEGGKSSPVLLELFHNQFASIAEQMGETLRQTALSVNVKERLDYSCAVFDAAGALIANAPHVPVHLGAMSETVKNILNEFPEMQPGEAYVANDPYRGGSHLPDVTVVTPMFPAEGPHTAPEFFVASRAHHADIGGITPGSMPPFSKTLAEEGVVIRPFRLLSAQVNYFDDLRKLLESGPWPSRRVEENLADIGAQLAANQIGVNLLQQLLRDHPRELIRRYVREIRETTAEKTRLALQQIPAGRHFFEDHLDDGSPIAVTITIENRHAEVDFTGTGPVLSSNLNANRAIVTAAVLYVFRCLIQEEIPLNSGVLDVIDIVLPECLLNPPADPDPARCPAVVGGNVETSQRVVDVLLGALNLAAASQGTMNNLTFGDDTFGYYETICGGSGATSAGPGCDAVHTHMTNTRLTDVEILEHRYPVRVQRHAVRTGSGGAGQHPGGNGLLRELQFLKPLSVSLLAQRRGPYAPFGLEGGQPGQTGQTTLLRSSRHTEEKLPGCFAIQVQTGDILRIETPGGGGWGKDDE